MNLLLRWQTVCVFFGGQTYKISMEPYSNFIHYSRRNKYRSRILIQNLSLKKHYSPSDMENKHSVLRLTDWWKMIIKLCFLLGDHQDTPEEFLGWKQKDVIYITRQIFLDDSNQCNLGFFMLNPILESFSWTERKKM